MSVLTYLNFNGNCREVLEFYRFVFGGEYMIMQTFGDGPPMTWALPSRTRTRSCTRRS